VVETVNYKGGKRVGSHRKEKTVTKPENRCWKNVKGDRGPTRGLMYRRTPKRNEQGSEAKTVRPWFRVRNEEFVVKYGSMYRMGERGEVECFTPIGTKKGVKLRWGGLV